MAKLTLNVRFDDPEGAGVVTVCVFGVETEGRLLPCEGTGGIEALVIVDEAKSDPAEGTLVGISTLIDELLGWRNGAVIATSRHFQ